MTLQDLADTIDLGKLPSGPRVLSRLISVIRQPGVQLEDVAELFRSDPALMARVMAACNSAYYSPGEPTVHFRDALLRLGLNEVSRIVQIVSLTDLRRYPTHLYTQTAGHFWERSLHTAYVMDEISGHDPYAYTAGIMHLVGIWVLCSAFPAAGAQSIAERELALQARLEQLRMGVSFAEAGALALTRWGFAAPICAAVDRQLTPSISEDPGNRLALLLNRAIAITDWHYGAKNQNSLIRSDLTITDLNECNQRAAAQVSRVGFGF